MKKDVTIYKISRILVGVVFLVLLAAGGCSNVLMKSPAAPEAAGPGGDVRIIEEKGRLAPLGHVVVIRVEDSGPGVPEDLREIIFQPFMSTKQEGTGLGLPIARRIFEDHGGWLHLHSAPGRGASFVAVLPARKDDDIWLR